MFTLVVFARVVGGIVSGSFIRAFDDFEKFSGGWDVRASAAAGSPVNDPARAIANAHGLDVRDYAAVSAQSFLPAEVRQTGVRGVKPADYVVRGLDDAFVQRTTYGFAARARGYENPWRALAEEPGTAVVDSFVAPRRDNWGAGAVMPEFQLRGFYLEDGVFDAVYVSVRDPQTGRHVRLKIVGVLVDSVPMEMNGIWASQRTLAGAFGQRVRPTLYFLDLRPGVDARAEAQKLEAAFVTHGVEADALQEVLDDAIASSWTFNRLVQGFMGLGLVVGVAALGVISGRAVVERRQHIGILRAIGFRRRMIQLSFLLESSFVALTAIVVGTVLGLILGYNIVADSAKQPSWDTLTFTVPWLSLGFIFAVVYAVALVTTLAPALRASRVYPAEALRYQ